MNITIIIITSSSLSGGWFYLEVSSKHINQLVNNMNQLCDYSILQWSL